jgi:hypothetical protein
LPLLRHRLGGEPDLSVLYDVWGIRNFPGDLATVFLQNPLHLPATEAELWAGPGAVFDRLTERLDAGWRVG